MSKVDDLQGVKVDRNVLIPARDGINLAADVYRPGTPGPHPAILIYGPYRKDDYALIGSYIGMREFYTRRGYAVVFVDVRGTCASEGTVSGNWSRTELEDGYDTVEWLADRPWCDGNIGMIGKSYVSHTALLVAGMSPPHLKAIVATFGAGDSYQVYYPGANIRYLMMVYASAFRLGLDFAPPAYRDPENRWVKVWTEHINTNEPLVFGELQHQVFSAYHRSRSSFEVASKIRIPTYLVSGWHDSVPSETLRMFGSIPSDVPKKVLIGPWTHSRPDQGYPEPKMDFLPESTKWFDRWLKGERNGIEAGPPVTVYRRGYDVPHIRRKKDSGEWRQEGEWPPRRFKSVEFCLGPGGALLRQEVGAVKKSGSRTFDYDCTVGTSSRMWPGMGWDVLSMDQRTDDVFSLCYETEPQQTAMEIGGAPVAVLYVSSTGSVATFVAKLNDVAPDGSSSLVSRGALNATRQLSFEEPHPMVPDQVYEIKLVMDDVSYVVGEGHRLRLSIAGADFPELWPTPQAVTNTVYSGEEHPSHLLLPVGSPEDPTPRITFADPEPLLSSIERRGGLQKWRIVSDVLSSRKKVVLRTRSEYKIDDQNRGATESGVSMTASRDNPEEGRAKAFFRLRVHPMSPVDVRAETRIHSDANAFHVFANVEITVDGSPYFSKAWTRSIPRTLM